MRICWDVFLIHSKVGGCGIPRPFPLPQHNAPALMYGRGRVQWASRWLDAGPGWNKGTCPRGEAGCRGWAPAPRPLGLHSAAASRGRFVYLFRDYVYELPEFMRSEVKWKVTVHRSSERLKFVKPRKWQDSAKWKVKSQVKGSVWMKVSSLHAGRTTHPSGPVPTSSASKCGWNFISWHRPRTGDGLSRHRSDQAPALAEVVQSEVNWGWFNLGLG